MNAGGKGSIIVVLRSFQPVLGEELGALDDQQAPYQPEGEIEARHEVIPKFRMIVQLQCRNENIAQDTQTDGDIEDGFSLFPHLTQPIPKMFCTDIRVKFRKFKNALG